MGRSSCWASGKNGPAALRTPNRSIGEVFYLDGLLALSVSHGPDQPQQPGNTEGGAARR